ncbi:MAG: LuxR C-terminal-related transcriptional regulator [Gammaproteobacteria bacterium]|nr:LuxR C-terminal-related transcriptional regulator [Gammaproteobacteria bacterium]
MNDQQDVLDIIGDIYEATINPEYWNRSLEKICYLSSARSAGIYIRDKRNNSSRTFCQIGMPEFTKALYSNGLGRLDPGFAMLEKISVGENCVIVNLQKPDGASKEFLHLVLRPMGIHHISCICVFNDDDLVGGIGLHRGKNSPPFEEDILNSLGLLAPHFARAIRIKNEFERLRFEKKVLQDGYSKLNVGMIVVDELARPRYMNPMAEKLVKYHPAVILGQDRRIKAFNQEQTLLLHQLVRECVEGNPGYSQMGLRHPEVNHPLVMMVTPITNEVWDKNEQGAIIFINDPAEDKNVYSLKMLFEVYLLSQAEARVAMALFNGLTADQIATQFNRSINTVKTQIKRVYAKTGVSRQADLVRLLTGSLVPFE